MKKLALFLVCLMVFTSVASAAERGGRLGTYGDWTAYKVKENGGNLCYMAASPQVSKGKYKRRGEVFLIIAHRPKAKTFNVVSLTAGYNYKKGSTATIKIDKKKAVELFTHEDTAWANTTTDEARLYAMMKAGNKAVVTGKSSLGNTTTDTFSLKGFTAAAKAIDKACGKK